MTSNSLYHSYLLRLWRTHPDGSWHASLHCTATDEQYIFHEVAELFNFLTNSLKSAPESISDKGENDGRHSQE
jgi:hypothetical protein